MAFCETIMVVSHANDSYFWVVIQFSGLSLNQGYRLQTLGTLVEGVTAVLGVWVLSLILL
jgi:GntP family gluconate:H+ symporter